MRLCITVQDCMYDKQLQIKYVTTRKQKVPLSDNTGII